MISNIDPNVSDLFFNYCDGSESDTLLEVKAKEFLGWLKPISKVELPTVNELIDDYDDRC